MHGCPVAFYSDKHTVFRTASEKQTITAPRRDHMNGLHHGPAVGGRAQGRNSPLWSPCAQVALPSGVPRGRANRSRKQTMSFALINCASDGTHMSVHQTAKAALAAPAAMLGRSADDWGAPLRRNLLDEPLRIEEFAELVRTALRRSPGKRSPALLPHDPPPIGGGMMMTGCGPEKGYIERRLYDLAMLIARWPRSIGHCSTDRRRLFRFHHDETFLTWGT
jgi:hypothetical protein